MTLVVGNQALAVEVIRQAAQNMVHIEGRHFIVLLGEESPDMRVASKGFANYLNVHRNIYGVRALESGRGSDERLREMIGRKLNLPANLLVDVFEVDPNLGSALLLAPKGDTMLASPRGADRAGPALDQDGPPIGRLDKRDFVLSGSSEGRRPARNGGHASDPDQGSLYTPDRGGAGSGDANGARKPRENKKRRNETTAAKSRTNGIADWAFGLFRRSPTREFAGSRTPPASLDDLPVVFEENDSTGMNANAESARKDRPN